MAFRYFRVVQTGPNNYATSNPTTTPDQDGWSYVFVVGRYKFPPLFLVFAITKALTNSIFHRFELYGILHQEPQGSRQQVQAGSSSPLQSANPASASNNNNNNNNTGSDSWLSSSAPISSFLMKPPLPSPMYYGSSPSD